jgi:hypothetical protein
LPTRRRFEYNGTRLLDYAAVRTRIRIRIRRPHRIKGYQTT